MVLVLQSFCFLFIFFYLFVFYVMRLYDFLVQNVGIRVCKQRKSGTMASWGYEATRYLNMGSPHEGFTWYCKSVSGFFIVNCLERIICLHCIYCEAQFG